MLILKEKNLFRLILFFSCILIVLYLAYLQFLWPTFYDADSYYHTAISNFLKNSGPRYEFSWNQFSTFKDFFSDNDFLFHVLIAPFLYFFDNIVTAGKYAVLFFNLIFILLYVFILRRYLPDWLASIFLFLPFLSTFFSFHLLLLRGAIAGNILMILGIYFLINKKWIRLFILSLIYPLTHLSFIAIVVFALGCELIRYALKREFFPRNIYAAILGTLIGCLIHPNFPNNFVSFHLNVVLAAFHIIKNSTLMNLAELSSSSARFVFLNNFALFLTLNVIIYTMFLGRARAGFPTMVWWVCASVYIVMAFFCDRFWYNANLLFYIFAASYLSDWKNQTDARRFMNAICRIFFVYALIIILVLPYCLKVLTDSIQGYARMNTHYEDVARWMNRNIPDKELIFHAYSSDSSYFICLNPKNRYIVSCDPIYMYHRYPREFGVYKGLTEGMVDNPRGALREVFRVTYGYTRNNNPLYRQIKKNPPDFKILYEDEFGIVFKII